MTISTFTSREFNQDVRKIKKAAAKGRFMLNYITYLTKESLLVMKDELNKKVSALAIELSYTPPRKNYHILFN